MWGATPLIRQFLPNARRSFTKPAEKLDLRAWGLLWYMRSVEMENKTRENPGFIWFPWVSLIMTGFLQVGNIEYKHFKSKVFSRADRHWSCAVVMLHNVNCQQPFSICNKWFALVGLMAGGSHAKVGGTRNQIASITVLHPCPLAQLTGKILNDRHQSGNTKKVIRRGGSN